MKTLIKNASVYHNHRFETLDLLLEDGRIARMGGCGDESCDKMIDAGGSRVVPGFLDIHTHGAVGVDVNGADVTPMAAVILIPEWIVPDLRDTSCSMRQVFL